MYSFEKYCIFEGIEPIVETRVDLPESGPVISITLGSRFGSGMLPEFDRLVERIRSQINYNPLDSIF